MAVDAELLEMLVCPKCHGKLEQTRDPEGEGLKCEACRLVYPIKDDIPVMLVDEAKKL